MRQTSETEEGTRDRAAIATALRFIAHPEGGYQIAATGLALLALGAEDGGYTLLPIAETVGEPRLALIRLGSAGVMAVE